MRKLFFRASPFFEQERQFMVYKRLARFLYVIICVASVSAVTPLFAFARVDNNMSLYSFSTLFDFTKNYKSIKNAIFDVALGIDFSVILLKVILALLFAIAVLGVVYLIRVSRLRQLRAHLIKLSCLLHADLVRVHTAPDEIMRKRAIADRDDSLFKLRTVLGQKRVQRIIGDEYARKFNELIPVLLSEGVGFDERTAALDYLMFYITHLT
jgi:hypothetical protein